MSAPPSGPTVNTMQREGRNVFALLTLFCGITSWVPWVIVITFPLAIAFAGLALLTAWKRDQRRGLDAALHGVLLAVAALATHLFIVGGLAFVMEGFAWAGCAPIAGME